jgi:hypothetical protein
VPAEEWRENIAEDLHSLAVDIELLDFLPGNPNVGDVEAVMRSYEEFGQRKPIVVQRRKRSKRGTVEAGNTQLQAALNLGWTKIAVVWVSDDDLTAAAFALADNRSADLGTTDEEKLVAMLRMIQDQPALLSAASYDDEATRELLAALDGAAEPFHDFTTPVVDNLVTFRFGDYSGKVERATYATFVKLYESKRDSSGAVLLDEVLSEWLGL